MLCAALVRFEIDICDGDFRTRDSMGTEKKKKKKKKKKKALEKFSEESLRFWLLRRGSRS